MARTTFSGPVKSDNGFEGDIVGSVSGTISSPSGVITNLLCTTLTIGSSVLTTGSVVSGVVGTDQKGYLPVKIGATTKYIPLFTTLTL
jgi:hypothetical protein